MIRVLLLLGFDLRPPCCDSNATGERLVLECHLTYENSPFTIFIQHCYSCILTDVPAQTAPLQEGQIFSTSF